MTCHLEFDRTLVLTNSIIQDFRKLTPMLKRFDIIIVIILLCTYYYCTYTVAATVVAGFFVTYPVPTATHPWRYYTRKCDRFKYDFDSRAPARVRLNEPWKVYNIHAYTTYYILYTPYKLSRTCRCKCISTCT